MIKGVYVYIYILVVEDSCSRKSSAPRLLRFVPRHFVIRIVMQLSRDAQCQRTVIQLSYAR